MEQTADKNLLSQMILLKCFRRRCCLNPTNDEHIISKFCQYTFKGYLIYLINESNALPIKVIMRTQQNKVVIDKLTNKISDNNLTIISIANRKPMQH
jgi:hypothetical protein